MKASKVISLVLCFSFLVCSSLLSVFAGEKEITIIACSDFQNKSGNVDGAMNVNSILSAIRRDGITEADGFFCCGDYDYDTFNDIISTKEGILHVKNAVGSMVKEEDMIFVQGNHDAPLHSNVGLSPSGNNDTDNYGVFVIHNSDYTWKNPDEGRIKLTAQNLINYLNEKLEQGYDRPVFILSHLPLHYSVRTRDSGDAQYASYIFEALNSAAQKGLNIIFLHGHDHSNGYDDYLGGASVYLQKGDQIIIAQNSKTAKYYQTLNFTYMSAGYVGYYNNQNGADDTLTMTVFKIRGDEVTVSRYSKNGIHNLKSKGVLNAYKNETGYDPNTTVYPSPQRIELTHVLDKSTVKDIIELEYGTMRFERVDTLSQLSEDKQYLLVYNDSKDYIMLPKVVNKSDSDGTRIGFEIEETEIFGDKIAYSNLGDGYTWSFTRTDGGWLLGNGEGYAHFEKTSDKKITATLEKEGDVFVIDGSLGEFTFTTELCTLDYNDRKLINGYDGDPAEFYIYEYLGYDINIDGGTALSYAKAGDKVNVTAEEAPNGMIFDKWVILRGKILLDNETKPSATFTMTDGPVMLKATYKAYEKTLVSKTEHTRSVTPGVIVSCATAFVAIAVVTVTVAVVKKRRSEKDK